MNHTAGRWGAMGNKRAAGMNGPDYYPTPEWAVKALLSRETFTGIVHEPCCGDGAMAKALEAAGITVVSSDLHDCGYGTFGIDARTIIAPVENVATNPPYNMAAEILTHFLGIYSGKIAFLLRLSFLESKRRYPLFQEHPPARVYVFPERLSMSARGEVVKGGGTISYGWFIWDRSHQGETNLRWLPLGFKTKGIMDRLV